MPAPQKELFQRLVLIFEEAVKLPSGPERDRYLDSACGDDRGLREQVAGLLTSDAAVQQRSSSTATRLPRFGIYQARQLIGAGGMGAVYLATREDGEVRQQVAIKAIASAFHSPILEERLRRERQIVAELHHPNIAAFLGGGVTDDGFSYLAMEYVDGERIDSWCDSRRLPVAARLKLFLKVCAAVSFAHHHLIVHRDLKPGNVLVTAHGEPKLLDFGIARTLASDGSITQTTSSLFLTPLYSSPEVLQNQIATVSADVYSLGVLLYQLLNGRTPFGRDGATASEVVHAVLSTEAPTLSNGITADAAAARGQTPASLAAILRGDLAAILRKALARSPAERYASVEQFADDIHRHLDGRPVEATAAGSLYRARKFVLRHRSAMATVALVALSLVAGLAATLWQARLAERRFAVAHELARYLQFDLQKSVAKLPGATPVEADMARHSLEYLDRLSADRISDPALRTEVGEGYADLGALLGGAFQPNLGETAKGRESFRKAIAILAPLAAEDPNNRRARVRLERSRLELGRSLGFTGTSTEGLDLVKGAAHDLEEMAARWPSDFEVQRQASVAFQTLGTALSASNGYINAQNMDAAMDALRKSIAHATAAVALRPHDTDAIIGLSSDYKRTGDLTELRDRPGATTYFRQAAQSLDAIPAADRETPAVRNARSSALLGLGWNLGNLGDFKPSLAALDEARQIRDTVWQEDPQNINALYFRAIPYRDLGIISGYAGDLPAKLKNFLVVIGIDDQLLAKNPANRAYRFSRAEMQADAADLSLGAGHRDEAMRLARDGMAALRALAADPKASPVELAVAARHLLETKVPGMVDITIGLDFAKRSAAIDPKDAEVQEILGEAYWLNGDRDHAVHALEQSLSLIEPAPTPARRELEATLAHYRIAPPGK